MTNICGEEWKDIPGFEGEYAISNYGRLRSYTRIVIDKLGRRRTFEGKIKSPQINNVTGYVQYSICRHHKVINVYPHILVCTLFNGEKPGDNYTVNHKDMDKENCRWDNLEWVTYSQNTKHSYDNDPYRYRGGGTGKYQVVVVLRKDNGKFVKYKSMRELVRNEDISSTQA